MRTFGSSNTMAARVYRAITNHAPTGKYRRRFFPKEQRDCPECSVEQTRRHTLNVYIRYTRRRISFLEFMKNPSDSGTDFLDFLTDNLLAFFLC
jgi:hypothetical protein